MTLQIGFPKSIGIEDEFFVLEGTKAQNGRTQRLLLKAFAEKFNFRITATDPKDGLPIQINKDQRTGYFCIKFDSTYNIIEVAHPPFKRPNDVIDSIAKMRKNFETIIRQFDLKISYSGHKNLELTKDSFIEKKNIQNTISRPNSGKPLFDRFYHGKICSTQLHLTLDNAATYRQLPSYYQLEPLVPIYFSNSAVKEVAHCFRLLLLQDSFKDDYQFFGFPSELPRDEKNYNELKSGSIGFFRDYSLIVPREFGTWEFRSACNQPNIEAIARLLDFRVNAVRLLISSKWTPLSYSQEEMKKVFLEACVDPSRPLVQGYLAALEESRFFEFIDPKIFNPTHYSDSEFGLAKERA